ILAHLRQYRRERVHVRLRQWMAERVEPSERGVDRCGGPVVVADEPSHPSEQRPPRRRGVLAERGDELSCGCLVECWWDMLEMCQRARWVTEEDQRPGDGSMRHCD